MSAYNFGGSGRNLTFHPLSDEKYLVIFGPLTKNL